MMSPKPDIEKIKTIAEISTAIILPVGHKPYNRNAAETEINITTSPTIQKGISFARINTILFTGVTFIWLIVPFSFSITIFSAGKMPQMRVNNNTIKPGIIKFL